MWVFNGEEWTQDDGEEGSSRVKPEMPPKWIPELTPELQVIEIVELPKRHPVPPPPMTIP
jgi:hypothetical protein